MEWGHPSACNALTTVRCDESANNFGGMFFHKNVREYWDAFGVKRDSVLLFCGECGLILACGSSNDPNKGTESL